MRQKTAKKTPGTPFRKGHDPRRGGGKKGRSGRPKLAFKAECDRIARELVLPKIAAYLEGQKPDDTDWKWCAEWVVRYATEATVTAPELTGNGPFVVMGGLLPGLRKPE